MAATLAPTDPARLARAARQLTPGTLAHTLVLDALPAAELERYWDEVAADAESADELRAEAANERYFESRGYWEARAHEDWEASRGIFA